MPNMLQRGESLLRRSMKSAAGETVTYQQGTSTPVSLTMWPNGVQRYEVSGDDGITSEIVSFEWTCEIADLDGTTPRAGDRITRAGGREYEVLPIARQPCYEAFGASDPATMYLIRTKELA